MTYDTAFHSFHPAHETLFNRMGDVPDGGDRWCPASRFGANDTNLPSQMAAFLIAQGEGDYFSMSREWTDGGWGW